ncbi:MAG: hypothetical protein ACI9SI_001576 [Polaribacter sp.]|jgi:hypothetical protein
MREILFIFCLILISSCKTENKVQKTNFILGNWERLNDKEGKKTYEIWKADYTGLGITLKDNDTIFKEILSIVFIKDTLTLKVEGVNETSILFKFTSQTDTSFVAENPTHDFPTKIKYWLEDNQLKAHVSNKEFEISFVFKKKD